MKFTLMEFWKMAEEFDASWFELSNYNAVETFDISDWYFQLGKRQALHLSILINIDPIEKRKVGEWMHPYHKWTANELIESIKDQPIFVNKKPEMPVLSVKDAVFSDLHLVGFSNNNQENVSTLSIVEFISTFPYTPLSPPPPMASSNYKPMLTIDINASDEQLKKEFEEWLNDFRKTTKYKAREKIFTSKTMEKWVEYKVLPYLDLTLIAKAENKRLTQHKLGELLFPNEDKVDTTERIRATAKKHAKPLLDRKTLAALRIQAKRGIKNA
jgi:hypothetical protein